MLSVDDCSGDDKKEESEKKGGGEDGDLVAERNELKEKLAYASNQIEQLKHENETKTAELHRLRGMESLTKEMVAHLTNVRDEVQSLVRTTTNDRMDVVMDVMMDAVMDAMMDAMMDVLMDVVMDV